MFPFIKISLYASLTQKDPGQSESDHSLNYLYVLNGSYVNDTTLVAITPN